MAKEITGTVSKVSITDYKQRCASGGRLFYFTRNSNGCTVICPHCKHRH